MKTAALFLIIFPYLGLSIIPSDIQPFAILTSIITIVFYKFRIGLTSLIIFVVSCMLFFLASLNRLVEPDDINIVDLVRYSFGVITPFIVYVVFNNLNFNNSHIASVLDAVLILIAIGFLFNLLNLDFHRALTSRGIYEQGGSRGLVGFFPEQSRVSTHLILMAMVYYFIGFLSSKRIAIIIIFSAISMSGEFFLNAIVVSVLYLFFTLMRVFLKLKMSNNMPIWFLSIVLIAPLIFIVSDSAFLSGFRGFDIISRAFNSGWYVFAQDDGFLVKISGLFYGIGYMFDNPINLMIDSISIYGPTDTVVSIYNSIGASSVPTPQRLYSIFGVLVGDFGIIGLLVFIGLLLPLLSNLGKDNVLFNTAIVFLIYLFFVRSFLPLTTFWLAYFIMIKRGNDLR